MHSPAPTHRETEFRGVPSQTEFGNEHPEGALINLNTIPGNPGPQPNYNPLQDTAVVRYYSVIN